ncbi:hypothetical protein NDK43_20055 [Neobacillus pocheonensis]|uniref:Uncharacterized protein n=1 Tax=Neobacillus pocheonensis TaxID=363869 RepID=A0ABT0WD26_9BACI|nr:hypothetical protein [Neobacillus pocheonensis]
MWICIMVLALFIVILLVIEEVGYFLFNQYLYDPNYAKQLIWKKRVMTIITFFKKNQQTEMYEAKKKKSS